jgi:DnaJ-class molecular chaperone
MTKKIKKINTENIVMVKCDNCGGDGWNYHEANSCHTRPCRYCNETGLVPKTKSITGY